MASSVKIIGKVAVKVMPDTSKFKRDLEQKLDAIERQISSMKVRVVVDLDKAMKERLKNEVNRLKNDAEKKPIKLDTELDNGSAARTVAALAILTKRRNVTIDPDMDWSSYAAIGTALAALTGARVVDDMFGGIRDYLADFDRHVPKIGAVGNALGGLGIIAANMATNAFSIGLGIAQIGYAAIPLPGIIGGLAIGLGITIAAFKDFNDVLPGVADRIHNLQDSLSINFWNKAKAPIQEFINTMWPQFAAGVNDAATKIGNFFGTWATHLTTALSENNALKTMFDNLSESVTILTGYTDSFAVIIARLGTIGAAWLPKLAEWFGEMSEKFATFLTDTTDNQFNEWIQLGVDNLQALGEIIGNVVGILAGLSQAASEAGGVGLQGLATKLQAVEDIVKGNTFQTNLIDVLVAAQKAMDTITDTAGPAFGSFMDRLSGTITKIFPIVGDTLGGAFKALFKALDRPGIQEGLITFFEGVRKGVEKVTPILPELSDILGDMAVIAGDLATQIGAVVAEGFDLIKPAIDVALPLVEDFLDAIKPYPEIVALMVGAFAGFKVVAFIAAMGTATAAVVTNTIAFYVNAAAAAVSMAETMFIMALYAGSWIATAATAIASAASIALAWIIAAGPVILLIAAIAALIAIGILIWKNWDEIKAKAIEIWGAIKTWVVEKAEELKTQAIEKFESLKVLMAEKWEAIKTAAREKWEALKALVAEKVESMKVAVREKVEGLKSDISEKWESMKTAAREKWESLKAAVVEKVENLKTAAVEKVEEIKTKFAEIWEKVKTTASTKFGELKTAIETKVEEIKTYVSGIPAKIVTALGDLGGLLKGAGEAVMGGLAAGIAAGWEKIKSSVSAMADWIREHKGPISYDKVLLVPAGKAIMDGLLKGLESRYKGIGDSLKGLTKDIESSLTAGSDFQIAATTSLDASGGSAIKGLASSIGGSIAAPSGASDSGNMHIDNITIPLEDLAQLKSLEQFLDMLRVRSRQGVVANA